MADTTCDIEELIETTTMCEIGERDTDNVRYNTHEEGGSPSISAMSRDMVTRVVQENVEWTRDQMEIVGDIVPARGGNGKRRADDSTSTKHKHTKQAPMSDQMAYLILRRWMARFIQRTTGRVAQRFCSADGPFSFERIEREKIP